MSYEVEPTQKQKRAADEMIRQKLAGGNVNKGEALRKAGYGKRVQVNPKTVTSSLGFKVYMDRYGLTEENFAAWLSQDLEAKPGERLGELKLMADVLKLKDNTVNVNFNRADEIFESINDLIDDDKEDN